MNVYECIDSNLSVIDSIDRDRYPELFRLQEKTSIIRHLRGILLYMQQPDRWPIWPDYNSRYFSFSRNHMAAWCKQQGITGSGEAWQSHKILLTDMGLIQIYTVIGEQEDPVLQHIWEMRRPRERSMNLWSVPLYDDAVLQHAEDIAAAYRRAHANVTHLTKNMVIRIRGQQVADSLYRESGRTIQREEAAMWDLIKEVTTQRINEQRYATKDQIRNDTERLFRERMQMDLFAAADTVEERREQRSYVRAFDHIMNQKRMLFESIGCEYRSVKRTDRESLGLANTFRSWIVVKTGEE